MPGKFALFVTLTATSAMAHAHTNLELDGVFHRLLHAVGTDGLVVLGGGVLALVVGLIVRRATRACRAQER